MGHEVSKLMLQCAINQLAHQMREHSIQSCLIVIEPGEKIHTCMQGANPNPATYVPDKKKSKRGSH